MEHYSEYIIQKDEKAFCGACGKNVHLLCHEQMLRDKPAFYVCFHCGTVGEVGVGKVIRRD